MSCGLTERNSEQQVAVRVVAAAVAEKIYQADVEADNDKA